MTNWLRRLGGEEEKNGPGPALPFSPRSRGEQLAADLTWPRGPLGAGPPRTEVKPTGRSAPSPNSSVEQLAVERVGTAGPKPPRPVNNWLAHRPTLSGPVCPPTAGEQLVGSWRPSPPGQLLPPYTKATGRLS